MANKFPKPKKIEITIPMQKWHLFNKYRQLIVSDNSKRKLDMDFCIQSSNSNNKYIIKIKQKTSCDVPSVFIIFPNLKTYGNESIPHTYGMKKIKGTEYLKICPFHPKEDWNKTLIIADTVLLWSIEWIYFYELWLVSGKWCGGGKHPESEKDKQE